MPMPRIQIRLIADLQADEVVSEDLLPALDDLQAEVGGVVERHAEVPPHVDEVGDVAQHVEQVGGVY